MLGNQAWDHFFEIRDHFTEICMLGSLAEAFRTAHPGIKLLRLIAAVGSTLFLTTDFDVMTRASFLDRVITMQLDSKYRS
jgi:hypothetical protein